MAFRLSAVSESRSNSEGTAGYERSGISSSIISSFFLSFSAVGKRSGEEPGCGARCFCGRESRTPIRTTLKEAACCGLALQINIPRFATYSGSGPEPFNSIKTASNGASPVFSGLCNVSREATQPRSCEADLETGSRQSAVGNISCEATQPRSRGAEQERALGNRPSVVGNISCEAAQLL